MSTTKKTTAKRTAKPATEELPSFEHGGVRYVMLPQDESWTSPQIDAAYAVLGEVMDNAAERVGAVESEASIGRFVASVVGEVMRRGLSCEYLALFYLPKDTEWSSEVYDESVKAFANLPGVQKRIMSTGLQLVGFASTYVSSLLSDGRMNEAIEARRAQQDEE